MAAKEYGLYVDGKWTDASSKDRLDTINPATGEVLARFPKATREDTRSAIEAAKRAYPSWAATPAPRRGEILLEAARILRRRKKELSELVTKEMGKVLPEGAGDVQEAIDFYEYIAGEGRRLLGETTTSELKSKFAMWVRRPKGAVGLITPWNFPIAIPSWKTGAALVAGNTCVFKPASTTPLCAAALVEVLEEAGLPPGVLNLVTGDGSVVGREIAENPAVAHVSFTGGTTAGRDVYTRAAGLLKSVELEMGGKNPQIVLDDANLDLALDGVLWGAFGTSGQRCTATSRLIVHERVYDELVARLADRLRTFAVGNPLESATQMGPVHSEDQLATVEKYVKIGLTEDKAKLLSGGKRLTGGAYDKGFFYAPTIFEARHGMRITKEEIFGPVLSVLKVRDFDEAVRVANDVEYGLSSSIYTRNVNHAFRAIEALDTGITYVNAPTIGAEVHLPFGGTKNTGNGGREAGTTAVDEFTEQKAVFVDYSDRLQRAQIDKE
ncbi:MAG TPA: aldehyde dehydrogenase family protein [Candidatus Thermoplasmatota archaeon]|nr:aldehyde dehydrogenase family protein [Candidatus Thermoplasmatota archaeon]